MSRGGRGWDAYLGKAGRGGGMSREGGATTQSCVWCQMGTTLLSAPPGLVTGKIKVWTCTYACLQSVHVQTRNPALGHAYLIVCT